MSRPHGGAPRNVRPMTLLVTNSMFRLSRDGEAVEGFMDVQARGSVRTECLVAGDCTSASLAMIKVYLQGDTAHEHHQLPLGTTVEKASGAHLWTIVRPVVNGRRASLTPVRDN